MADFNALEALINAYIKQNGVKAITGNILNGVLRGMVSALGKGWTIADGDATPTTDPGTMTGPVAYIAHTAGTYEHFGNLVVNDGEVALLKYNEQTWTKEVIASLAATASIDGNVGTPAVDVTFQNGVLSFDFRNMKGDTGDAAGFGTVNATVDANIGTPGVSVQTSGPDTAKNMTFAFTNLKGETGVTSVVATVDNTVGTPSCAVSLVGQELHLDFTGLKGPQGDTGSSVDYPFTIVNNLTTNDATQALSAAMGVQLESELSQLDLEVSRLAGRFYGVFEDDSDLPDDATSVGYAFVGENEPFAIWNFNGTAWSDSGAEAVGLQGPQGNSGYTGAVGELEVVNNLEDGGATAALSAEMGKLLSRNIKLLYDSMGAAAFWGDKPNIDWSGNGVPVSLSLTKCSTNNLSATVQLGDSYEATITPDAGAILDSVSCVMNGETQTVTNGVINIAEVTGAIIITAVAYDLNSVAYESLTYKQIFETNNVLGITAGFENGSYSPLTVNAGSPSITTEDKDSGTYSLKCSGTSSQQVRTSTAYTVAMYIACRCKVTAYTQGACGIQSGGVDAALTEVSDWVTKTANRTSTTSSAVFLGSLSSANLTGYVDTPVAVRKSIFTTVPSLTDFTALYNKYVALKKL